MVPAVRDRIMTPVAVYLLAVLALNPGAAVTLGVPPGCRHEAVPVPGGVEVRILCPAVPR